MADEDLSEGEIVEFESSKEPESEYEDGKDIWHKQSLLDGHAQRKRVRRKKKWAKRHRHNEARLVAAESLVDDGDGDEGLEELEAEEPVLRDGDHDVDYLPRSDLSNICTDQPVLFVHPGKMKRSAEVASFTVSDELYKRVGWERAPEYVHCCR